MLLQSLVAAVLVCTALAGVLPNVPIHKLPCTPLTAQVRKEWSDLTAPERKAYIAAVQCLKTKPSKYAPGVVPGSLSHYDDFVATHINSTLRIHLNGVFLGWHREFLHLYEKALQQECGYKGAQPYWDWQRSPVLAKSPLFDGSETSLSGDGVFDPNGAPYNIGPGVVLAHGTGGGCATSGPFKDWQVNFGPFDTFLAFIGQLPPKWEQYTPHCLTRDLNDPVINAYGNKAVVDRLLGASTIAEFQGNLTGFPVTLDGLGPHPGMHIALGQSLQDFFASPGDPTFYLHHGQVDRTWELWVSKDEKHRRFATNGTSSFGYEPTTPEVDLNTVIDFGVLGPTKKLGEVMNPRAGAYCYRYQ